MATEIKISPHSLIRTKPGIELQEVKDRWGILYDTTTDFSFLIKPVSVFIWKQLLNLVSFEELIIQVKENCIDVPDEVEDHVALFIKHLLERDLAYISLDSP